MDANQAVTLIEILVDLGYSVDVAARWENSPRNYSCQISGGNMKEKIEPAHSDSFEMAVWHEACRLTQSFTNIQSMAPNARNYHILAQAAIRKGLSWMSQNSNGQ